MSESLLSRIIGFLRASSLIHHTSLHLVGAPLRRATRVYTTMRRRAHVLEERIARHKRACARFALKHLRITAPTALVAIISLWLSLPLFAHAYPVIRTSNRRRKRKIGKLVFVFNVSFVPLPPTCFRDRTTAPTRGFKRVVVLVSIKNRRYFAPRFGVGNAHVGRSPVHTLGRRSDCNNI